MLKLGERSKPKKKELKMNVVKNVQTTVTVNGEAVADIAIKRGRTRPNGKIEYSFKLTQHPANARISGTIEHDRLADVTTLMAEVMKHRVIDYVG